MSGRKTPPGTGTKARLLIALGVITWSAASAQSEDNEWIYAGVGEAWNPDGASRAWEVWRARQAGAVERFDEEDAEARALNAEARALDALADL